MTTKPRAAMVSVVGPPASGKSTAVQRIASDFEAAVVSPGAMLRRLARQEGSAGDDARRILDAQGPAPLSLISNAIEEAADQSDLVLLDGIPRTGEQLRIVLSFGGSRSLLAVLLEGSLEEAADRIGHRFECSACGRIGEASECTACGEKASRRPDDDFRLLEYRFSVFSREVDPVIAQLARQVKTGSTHEVVAELRSLGH